MRCTWRLDDREIRDVCDVHDALDGCNICDFHACLDDCDVLGGLDLCLSSMLALMAVIWVTALMSVISDNALVIVMFNIAFWLWY